MNWWERYANFFLLRLCLRRAGIGDYELNDESRKRWLRAGAMPKPGKPELLRSALAAKRRVVEQAVYDNSIGQRWDDDDFKDTLAQAIQAALGESVPTRETA